MDDEFHSVIVTIVELWTYTEQFANVGEHKEPSRL